MTNKRVFWLLFLIIIIGLGLRLINLGTESFWGDEALSLDVIKHYESNIPGMIEYLKTVEVHPPVYYLLLNFWVKIFGGTEMSVRSLSLIFGLGVILLVYWLGFSLFRRKEMALLSAFFIAILPFQIEFSQEARPYILFCFMAIFATISWWYYHLSRKFFWLTIYILATLLGLFLHYSFIFFATALAGFWLFDIFFLSQPKSRKISEIFIWLGAHSFIFLAYFSQLINLFYKTVLGQYTLFGVNRQLGGNRPVDFFGAVVDQLFWLTKNITISKVEVLIISIFKISLVIAFIWLIYRCRELFLSKLKEEKEQLFYLVWLATLPLLFFLISSYSVRYAPIYERHIITSSVFLTILLAYFFSFFKFKIKTLLSILFILSFANMLVVVLGDDSVWDGYFQLKSSAQYINSNYRPGDIVIISDTIGRSNINHYLRPELSALSLYPLGLLDYHFDFLSSRETLGLGENEAQLRYYSIDDSTGASQEFSLKMNYIFKEYKPKRIWYLFPAGKDLGIWLTNKNWRLAMNSLGRLHPLELYDSNNPNISN